MSQDLSEGEEDKELSALLLELWELRGGGPGEWEPVGNDIAGILRRMQPRCHRYSIVVADIIARVWAWLSGLQKARIFCAQSFLLIRMFVPVVPRQP